MSQADLDIVKGEAKRRLHRLVEDYMNVLTTGRKESFNEERVKIAFMLPFLEALDWNPRTDEVLPEQATLTGRADFGLRVGGRTRVFVELKSFKKSLDGYDIIRGKHRSYAEQAIQYAWGMKADWAVLTNFEEIRLYDSHVKKPEDGLVWKKPIRFTEYESRFDDLWLVSKRSVVSGALDAYKARVERPSVDEAFLTDLMNCRELLAEDVQKNNPKLTYDQINESVQKLLDRLIFIRNCEDRLIIPAESLWKRFKAWQETAIDEEIVTFMMDLKNLFRYFDRVYNGKLFEKHPCENLKISNRVLEEIVDTLYGGGQHLGYNFSVIPVDVLGEAYELYIGSMIKEKEGHAKALEIVKRPVKRKAHGIYYTPEYVVDYIIRSTVGELLNDCRTPQDVSVIKVLDPACGSGSFLIKTFDVIKEWYERYNKKKRGRIDFNTLDPHLVSIPNVEQRILTENLYGIDFDEQAVEISILNLSLKAVRTRTRLPHMGDHLRCGNSLISGSEKELKKYFDEPGEKKPFNWDGEFSTVLKIGGFSAIVGNPPYVQLSMAPLLQEEYKKYLVETYGSSMGRLNTFGFFIHLGISKLAEGGYLGFIVPNTLLTMEYYQELRRQILEHCRIISIVTFESMPFEDAVVENIIMILQRESKDHKRMKNLIKIVDISEQATPKYIEQETFHKTYKNAFNIRLSPKLISLQSKLKGNRRTLGQLANINQAIALKHDRKESLFDTKEGTQYKKVLDGRDIGRYSISFPNIYLLYDKDKIHSCKREDIFLAKEKILFRRVGERIIAAYDDKQHYALNTLVVLRLKDIIDKVDLKFILALLNSKLVNFYYVTYLKSMKTVFSEIQARQIKQLPISIDVSNLKWRQLHDDLVGLINKMTSLHALLNKIPSQFEAYLSEPVLGHTRLRQFYDQLSASEREVLDRTTRGTVKKLSVNEQGNALLFKVDFDLTKHRKVQRFKGVEILKCQFRELALRKFLLHYIQSYDKPLGTGNLLHKLLTLKIPFFDKNPVENKRIIEKMMKEFLKAMEERGKLEAQIEKTERTIDKKIYKLYDLTEEEVELIEKSMRKS